MSLRSDVNGFMKTPLASVDAAKTIVRRLDARVKELEKQLADLGVAAAGMREHGKHVIEVHNETAEAVTCLLREMQLGDQPRETSIAHTIMTEIIPKVRRTRQVLKIAHNDLNAVNGIRETDCGCSHCADKKE